MKRRESSRKSAEAAKRASGWGNARREEEKRVWESLDIMDRKKEGKKKKRAGRKGEGVFERKRIIYEKVV